MKKNKTPLTNKFKGRDRILWVSFLLLCLIPFGVGGCGTTVGNGLVAVNIEGYTPSASSTALVKNTSALATLTSMTMCFKKLRLKTSDADGGNNIDLKLGEVTLDASGTSLENVAVPLATYTKVEFDLNEKCDSGKSLQVTNGNGTYSTNKTITIKFKGKFSVTGLSQMLKLKIQKLVNAVAQATSDDDLVDKIEAADGDIDN